MTHEWKGTSTYGPGDAVNYSSSGNIATPHMVALSNGKFLITWVVYDQTEVLPARHCAAVGSIVDGGFVADTEVMLVETIPAATFTPVGSAWGYEDAGGVFLVSSFDNGTGSCRMVIARANLDLSSPTVKVVDISDGGAQPYLRNDAVAFNGHYFRLTLNRIDGVTVTVHALDSSFNDGATTAFVMADSYPQLGGFSYGSMVSGGFACFSANSSIGVLAHYNGTTITDVWTRTGSTNRIQSALATPGHFAAYDGSFYELLIHADRSETVVSGPISIIGSGSYDSAQVATGSPLWSFTTGDSGGS